MHHGGVEAVMEALKLRGAWRGDREDAANLTLQVRR